jgi:hypothetical protein
MTRKISLVLLFTLRPAIQRRLGKRPPGARPCRLPGTVFTYQGSRCVTRPAGEGAYDLQFALYDALAEGAQVGETLAMEDVPVSGGLFSVSLDFGAVFDGQALFLEVSVRPGSTDGAFTTLAPRQALTPAPYSLYAPQAGQAETAVTADGAAFASRRPKRPPTAPLGRSDGVPPVLPIASR